MTALQKGKMMTELEPGTRRKIYCNRCGSNTNHELKVVLTGPYHEEGDDRPYPAWVYWEKTEYRLWSCLGCDTATLEEVFTSEPMRDQDDNQIWTSVFHPKPVRHDLPRKRFRRLDRKLASIYGEVVEAFNAELRTSCAMGLRALLEGICVDRGITDKEARGLEAKLRKLEKDGHLPTHIVDGLHSFKFMGDSAAHRLEAPTQEELKLAIDVMEDLLNFLYEAEYRLASKAKALAKMRAAELQELKKRRKKDPAKSK